MTGTLYVDGLGTFSPYAQLSDFPAEAPGELPKPDLGLLERSLRRGLSDVTRMFMHAAQLALRDAQADAHDLHVVFASAFGELGTAEALMDLARTENASSPARFRNSVHNSAVGLLSISANNVLPATAVAAGWNSVAMGLMEAQAQLASGARRVLLVFAEEAVPTSLSGEHGYAPLAVALVLSRSLPSRPPRGTLSQLSRAKPDVARSLRDPFGPSNHPLGPAMLLAHALAHGKSELIQVGNGQAPWCIEVRALQPKSKTPSRELSAEATE